MQNVGAVSRYALPCEMNSRENQREDGMDGERRWRGFRSLSSPQSGPLYALHPMYWVSRPGPSVVITNSFA